MNNHLMQFQADLLDVEVQRPIVAETTALGAAYLAGLAVGYWESTADITKNWALGRKFEPNLDAAKRASLRRGWSKALGRTLDWEE